MKPGRVALAAFGLALLIGIGLLFGLTPSARELPAFDEVRVNCGGSESILLDRHGEILHELRTDRERRRLAWTPLGGVSPALREAVVQAEDRRFSRHRGVDLLSMGAALFHGVTSESLRGASTISMQLASILDPALQAKALPVKALPANRAPSKLARRSLAQKVKQILAARELERSWSKDEILEAYLSLVTFRGELQGVAAASRGLFGKDPHGLDRTESLILASLIRSPNASPASVRARAARLGMEIGWGVPGGEIEAKVRGALERLSYVRPRADLAPHVARKLLAGKAGGSAVTCTLDGTLQRVALERLLHRLVPLRAQNVADGAVLVVENLSGEVLAYVSHSGEPSKSRYVDGARAKRQAGSALKPFLYALAFDRHILTPASMLEDSPLDIAVFGGIYQPRNYDSDFLGIVSARTALASSLNVPAVRVLSLVGVDLLLRTLGELGIEGLSEAADFYGPSLALGSADVTLWELVGAYRALANGGVWSELRVTGEPGPTGGTGLSGEAVPAEETVPTREAGPHSRPRSSDSRRVFSPEAAFLVSDILSDRDARSFTFGLENPLATPFWTAVKTGTSKDMRDNWCVGYSERYTVGVWVGNFSGEPMWNVSGMSGAAPVWIDVMSALHKRGPASGRRGIGEPETGRPRPPALVRQRVRFPGGREPPREEWFVAGTEPLAEEQAFSRHGERILYPPPGTIIAVDPDIPPERQAVFFLAQNGGRGNRWVLNGEPLGSGARYISWVPVEGKYTLSVEDLEGHLVDTVEFEVRGLPLDER